MSLPLAIALNAIAAISLLGLLGWAMSRPAKLVPHVSARSGRRFELLEAAARGDEGDERIAA